MRIPKKSGPTPPAGRSEPAESSSAPKSALETAATESQRAAASEPQPLSDVLFERLFQAAAAAKKHPAPLRRTTARLQRSFADAFLSEPPAVPPLEDLPER